MSTEQSIQAAIVRVDMFIEKALPVARVLAGTMFLVCGVFAAFSIIRRIKRKRSRHRKRKRRKRGNRKRYMGGA